jgi:hypothetical protein
MRRQQTGSKLEVADLKPPRLDADLKVEAVRGGQMPKGTRPVIGAKWEGPDFDA